MKIVVISPEFHKYPQETQLVTKFFEKGLGTYHLFKPFYKFSTMVNFINEIPQNYHNRIILHSHHSLIRKFNLGGLHYTKMHLEPNFKNWWNDKRLSSHIMRKTQTATCKKLSELKGLGDRHYSYVFLSPIFDTLTGKYQSGYYENEIKNALQNTGTRVIAKGGIDINRIEKVQELGFYGMALHNCIWGKENPVAEYCRIMDKCYQLGVFIE